MTRKRLLPIGGLLVVLLTVIAVVGWRSGVLGDDDPPPTSLAQAMALAPEGAQRFSWTDWAGVRRELGVSLDSASSGALVEDLLDRGFEADLTSTSALLSSAPTMQTRLGFSPASLDWELYSQGTGGASLLMKPGASVSFEAVRDALTRAGYEDPGSPDGLWAADPETDAITAQVTAELQFVAFDDERGLMVASDTMAGALAAVAALDESGAGPVPVAALDAVGSPLSAALYTGTEVCGSLAMVRADPDDQEIGEALIAAAGKVNPMSGFVMAAESGGGLRVAMSFDNPEQARVNAETRAVLAAGPAPGQGGDFSERFTLGEVRAQGAVVVMDLTPVEGSYVLSDLSTGPVLFATC